MIDSRLYLDHLRKVIDRNRMHVGEIVLPDEREIELRGLRLHYHDWGTPAAPTVIFLHGGGLTAHTWDAVCLGLRSNYRCLALDFRGHGDSDWSEDYDIDAHVEDVRAFIAAFALGDVNLVGMSMGGMVAVRYAGRYPDLNSLVVIDVGPDAGRQAGTRRIQDFVNGVELDTIDEFVERALKFNPKRDRDLLRGSLLHNLRRLPNGRWTWKYDRRHYVRPRDASKVADFSKDTWACVPEISCPVLVVRGSESDILSAEAAHSFADSFPSARLVEVSRAGHTVQGDNPADLTIELLHFLSQVTYRRS